MEPPRGFTTARDARASLYASGASFSAKASAASSLARDMAPDASAAGAPLGAGEEAERRARAAVLVEWSLAALAWGGLAARAGLRDAKRAKRAKRAKGAEGAEGAGAPAAPPRPPRAVGADAPDPATLCADARVWRALVAGLAAGALAPADQRALPSPAAAAHVLHAACAAAAADDDAPIQPKPDANEEGCPNPNANADDDHRPPANAKAKAKATPNTSASASTKSSLSFSASALAADALRLLAETLGDRFKPSPETCFAAFAAARTSSPRLAKEALRLAERALRAAPHRAPPPLGPKTVDALAEDAADELATAKDEGEEGGGPGASESERPARGASRRRPRASESERPALAALRATLAHPSLAPAVVARAFADAERATRLGGDDGENRRRDPHPDPTSDADDEIVFAETQTKTETDADADADADAAARASPPGFVVRVAERVAAALAGGGACRISALAPWLLDAFGAAAASSPASPSSFSFSFSAGGGRGAPGGGDLRARPDARRAREAKAAESAARLLFDALFAPFTREGPGPGAGSGPGGDARAEASARARRGRRRGEADAAVFRDGGDFSVASAAPALAASLHRWGLYSGAAAGGGPAPSRDRRAPRERLEAYARRAFGAGAGRREAAAALAALVDVDSRLVEPHASAALRRAWASEERGRGEGVGDDEDRLADARASTAAAKMASAFAATRRLPAFLDAVGEAAAALGAEAEAEAEGGDGNGSVSWPSPRDEGGGKRRKRSEKTRPGKETGSATVSVSEAAASSAARSARAVRAAGTLATREVLLAVSRAAASAPRGQAGEIFAAARRALVRGLGSAPAAETARPRGERAPPFERAAARFAPGAEHSRAPSAAASSRVALQARACACAALVASALAALDCPPGEALPEPARVEVEALVDALSSRISAWWAARVASASEARGGSDDASERSASDASAAREVGALLAAYVPVAAIVETAHDRETLHDAWGRPYLGADAPPLLAVLEAAISSRGPSREEEKAGGGVEKEKEKAAASVLPSSKEGRLSRGILDPSRGVDRAAGRATASAAMHRIAQLARVAAPPPGGRGDAVAGDEARALARATLREASRAFFFSSSPSSPGVTPGDGFRTRDGPSRVVADRPDGYALGFADAALEAPDVWTPWVDDATVVEWAPRLGAFAFDDPRALDAWVRGAAREALDAADDALAFASGSDSGSAARDGSNASANAAAGDGMAVLRDALRAARRATKAARRAVEAAASEGDVLGDGFFFDAAAGVSRSATKRGNAGSRAADDAREACVAFWTLLGDASAHDAAASDNTAPRDDDAFAKGSEALVAALDSAVRRVARLPPARASRADAGALQAALAAADCVAFLCAVRNRPASPSRVSAVAASATARDAAAGLAEADARAAAFLAPIAPPLLRAGAAWAPANDVVSANGGCAPARRRAHAYAARASARLLAATVAFDFADRGERLEAKRACLRASARAIAPALAALARERRRVSATAPRIMTPRQCRPKNGEAKGNDVGGDALALSVSSRGGFAAHAAEAALAAAATLAEAAEAAETSVEARAALLAEAFVDDDESAGEPVADDRAFRERVDAMDAAALDVADALHAPALAAVAAFGAPPAPAASRDPEAPADAADAASLALAAAASSARVAAARLRRDRPLERVRSESGSGSAAKAFIFDANAARLLLETAVSALAGPKGPAPGGGPFAAGKKRKGVVGADGDAYPDDDERESEDGTHDAAGWAATRPDAAARAAYAAASCASLLDAAGGDGDGLPPNARAALVAVALVAYHRAAAADARKMTAPATSAPKDPEGSARRGDGDETADDDVFARAPSPTPSFATSPPFATSPSLAARLPAPPRGLASALEALMDASLKGAGKRRIGDAYDAAIDRLRALDAASRRLRGAPQPMRATAFAAAAAAPLWCARFLLARSAAPGAGRAARTAAEIRAESLAAAAMAVARAAAEDVAPDQEEEEEEEEENDDWSRGGDADDWSRGSDPDWFRRRRLNAASSSRAHRPMTPSPCLAVMGASLELLRALAARGDRCRLGPRCVARVANAPASLAPAMRAADPRVASRAAFAPACAAMSAILRARREETRRAAGVITHSCAALLDVLRRWWAAAREEEDEEEEEEFERGGGGKRARIGVAAGAASGARARALAHAATALSSTYEEVKAVPSLGRYCGYLLSDAVAATSGADGGVGAEAARALRPGLFALLDACGDRELAQLRAATGTQAGGARRVALDALVEQHRATHKYDGKV